MNSGIFKIGFITFSVLVGLCIIGGVVITIVNPDAQATFSGYIFQILGLVTIGGGTFGSIARISRKLDRTNDVAERKINDVTETLETVKHNTNGALSLERARVSALKNALPSDKVKEILDEADAEHARANYKGAE